MAGEHITEDKHRCFRCGQSHPDTFACPSDPLTPKERSNELRAFADILRDTGRYGVDFADVERASLLSEAADELDRRRAEIAELREALEALYDEQNGPPLFARERQWKAAMERAKVALASSPVETTAPRYVGVGVYRGKGEIELTASGLTAGVTLYAEIDRERFAQKTTGDSNEP